MVSKTLVWDPKTMFGRIYSLAYHTCMSLLHSYRAKDHNSDKDLIHNNERI